MCQNGKDMVFPTTNIEPGFIFFRIIDAPSWRNRVIVIPEVREKEGVAGRLAGESFLQRFAEGSIPRDIRPVIQIIFKIQIPPS
jgi:hypothetical protein